MANTQIMEGREVNLFVFSEEDVPDILSPLGFTIKDKKIFYEGELRTCDCCGRDINIDELGNILPGSHLLYCKDITCFAELYPIHPEWWEC